MRSRWGRRAPGVALLALLPAAGQAQQMVGFAAIDKADTVWVLVATALVLLMTLPGVALFYAGMVRRKNVLNTLAAVLGAACVVSVVWFAVGYSLAFTPSSRWIGGLERLWFGGLDYQLAQQQLAVSHMAPHIPEAAYALFQLTFAIITAALIVGALVERMRFAALMLFMALWTLLVYVPVAHWVWEPGGWLARMGALDFAGGAVVHVNAGAAGLACACYLGKRTGYGREAFQPYNLGWTMLGACLLWVGWFGFNAGSAGAANGIAGLAFINTILATGAAAVSWIVAEALHKGKASMLGAASGAVAGLVTITPAAGFVGPMGSIVMGLIAGPLCLWGVSGLKKMLKVDDTCDVFGVHGVGGILGAILTGVFASQSLGGTGGLTPDTFAMGAQVWVQFKSVIVTMVWCGVVSFICFKVADVLVGLRVAEDAEREGLDITTHGESAYNR